MTESKSRKIFPHPLIIVAFSACFVVWFYLLYVTQPVVVFDSIGYEQLGKTIYMQGWVEFFKQGPHREFGYAFLISLAMRIADHLPVSYIFVLCFFQVLLLFFTQLGALVIARTLRLSPLLTAWVVLYIGLSPGILFSTFIVYSEVATYPFIPLIVIGAAEAWQRILTGNKSIVPGTIMLALSLFAATAVKGIFQTISYLLLVPFLFIFLKAFAQKNTAVCRRSILFFMLVGLFFYVPVNAYKLANKYYNGEFTLSDRSGRVLLASTLSRTTAASSQEIKALFAFTFFPNHCHQFVGDDALCDRWDWRYAEDLRRPFVQEYQTKHDITHGLLQREYTALALGEMLRHPFQYLLVTGIHSFRIFYWEYFYGFAAYPDWMDRFFVNPWVRLIVSCGSALLAFLACLFLVGWVWQRRKVVLDASQAPDMQIITATLLLLMLAGFGILSSLFWILDRYILPVASLYILAIAFLLDQTLRKSEKS